VFCTPSARPAHDMPAKSATAADESPLVLTVIAAATSSAAAATGDRHKAPNAVSPTTTAIATASWRIGRSLLFTRSDHFPAPILVSAPARFAAAIARLAASSAQPRWLTRYSNANPVITNCGTTSSVLAAWIRHSTGTR